ncbi:histidine kinase [Neptunitalea chrysea]|uniref:histidine kinase n=1 Tax=Neptunitalea chrysea TaxID=1647581 RepID=A0A9W6B877_9FLAO|nr:PAS domain S-box protein [Neptunitalea chrysea]GLB52618.1 histidine kinase [Neptunitalea chrysea]
MNESEDMNPVSWGNVDGGKSSPSYSDVVMGSWDIDLVNETIYWSKETYAIHELSQDVKLTLEEAFSFFEGDQLEILQEHFQIALVSNERYDLFVELTTAKKNKKWVRVVGIPVFEGKECVRIYGLIHDFSDTRIRENINKKQKEVFEKIFYEGSTGMGVSDVTGRFIMVNQSLCKIFGYSETELIGKSFRDITHPDDLEKSVASIKKFYSGEIKDFKIEKRYLSKSGSVIYGLLSASMINDHVGNPLFFVVQVTDITIRVEAEKKIQSLLDVTSDQNKRLLNFAHIVSHNLRSHSGNLTMLMDLIKEQNPNIFANEIVTYINKAVIDLSETISNLNEVVQVHTDRRNDLEILNLKSYIDKVLSVLTGTILETHCKVVVNVSEDLKVKYNPAYLDSVLLNLISNAIKYRSDERIPEINIFTEEKGTFLVLNVKDNGLGIDLEMYGDALFGMYKTFHVNKDSRGIGLFLTKNQVEAMGGKIEVESEVNKGSIFKVYLSKHEEN